MTPDSNSIRIKVVFIGSLVAFLIIPIVIFIVINTRNESVSVNNYDVYTKDLPQGQRSSINNAIYLAVKLNLVVGEKMTHSTASIREGSVTSSYNTDSDVHSGTFIVDLKEIRQSYFATYDWSENKDNPNTAGYPTRVLCLSDEKSIIYKDFVCKDGSEESSLALEYQLPYADINGPFEIFYMYKQRGNTVVGIDNSTPDGRKKALTWLRSKNVDPTDIIINHLDMRDQLRSFTYGTE